MIKTLNNRACARCLFVIVVMLSARSHVLAQNLETPQLKIGDANSISKIAPGEFLPVAVKLTNFGAKQRVDVAIDYKIIDGQGKKITEEAETVAVETTASFVKNVQLPRNLPAGTYQVTVSLLYEGQKTPAVSQFQFTVERKIFGIFAGQFFGFGAATLGASIAFATAGMLIVKRRRLNRLKIHDYSQVPKGERLFYEITSDIITQMRFRVGEKALELAKNIEGLSINDDGKILSITNDPAKIAALLILRYENSLGKRVSFAIRKQNQGVNKQVLPVEKNLVVIRKYSA